MRKRQTETGGIWALEEATGVLRQMPVRSWSVWLIGTLPFLWALIDLLMDMSSSAYAEERLFPKSLAVTLLYIAKHCAHALFTRDCLHVLRGQALDWPPFSALLRLWFVQAAVQPWRFIVLPLASMVIIPFPWCAAFFRNIGPSALDHRRGFVREAWKLALSDSRTHSIALLVLTLCWLLLFLNLFVLWFIVPMLLKAFLGWQTDFSRLSMRLLNGNTFLVTSLLTFAALEPVVCAMAAVRAFYDRARASGDDLHGSLRRVAAAIVLALLLAGPAALPMMAQQEAPRSSQAELDRSMDEVLRQPEFAWRLPKSEKEAGEWIWLRNFFENLEKWIRWIFDVLGKLLPEPTPAGAPPSPQWGIDPALLRFLMIAAAVIAAGAAVMILLSRRAKRNKTKQSAVAVAVPPAVDLADESLSAEQHPEDEWLRMADACAEQGQFRLGMRALHLAGLRYLGEKGWITLQPAKTGMEYGYEMQRRLRNVPTALEGYASGLRQFEVVWYGFAEAHSETYRTLRSEWESLRRHA